MNGAHQGVAGVLLEFESRAFLRTGIPEINRVVESAGRADNGYGAVLQSVYLREPRGFIPRRHQQHVNSRDDLVCQGIVISDANPNLLGHALNQAHEHLFVETIAVPEHGKVNLFQRKPVDGLADEIEAFLRGKARDDANQRNLSVALWQSEGGEQVALAQLF